MGVPGAPFHPRRLRASDRLTARHTNSPVRKSRRRIIDPLLTFVESITDPLPTNKSVRKERPWRRRRQVLARCVRGGIYAARGLREPLAKAEFEAAAQARRPRLPATDVGGCLLDTGVVNRMG